MVLLCCHLLNWSRESTTDIFSTVFLYQQMGRIGNQHSEIRSVWYSKLIHHNLTQFTSIKLKKLFSHIYRTYLQNLVELTNVSSFIMRKFTQLCLCVHVHTCVHSCMNTAFLLTATIHFTIFLTFKALHSLTQSNIMISISFLLPANAVTSPSCTTNHPLCVLFPMLIA